MDRPQLLELAATMFPDRAPIPRKRKLRAWPTPIGNEDCEPLNRDEVTDQDAEDPHQFRCQQAVASTSASETTGGQHSASSDEHAQAAASADERKPLAARTSGSERGDASASGDTTDASAVTAAPGVYTPEERDSVPGRNANRMPQSSVWFFFRIRWARRPTVARCLLCGKDVAAPSNNTTNLWRHLRRCHHSSALDVLASGRASSII